MLNLLGSICVQLYPIHFYRLLAREGLNAEQLARDLKSFELKVTRPVHFTFCRNMPHCNFASKLLTIQNHLMNQFGATF